MLVVQGDPRLEARLRALAGLRMVFFAGLPGTGKSLLVHQLAHLAAAGGRRVHLVQWDVARPVFEACPAGRRHPLVDGVTHVAVRKAAGLWVRRAVVDWHARHGQAGDLLIGETPFVGGRFVELARRGDDEAEARLTDPSSRFVLPVPSTEVRRFLEARRERRATDPLHPREREDAPPQVLRALWRDLADVARHLGLTVPGDAYDPRVYREVYTRVLRHRTVELIDLDVILPTDRLSVYDFATPPTPLIPTDPEAESFILSVEHHHPDPSALDSEMSQWWNT